MLYRTDHKGYDNEMKSPCCNAELTFRFPGGRKNQKNIVKNKGHLKLTCPSCGGKWLAPDDNYSHVYRTFTPSGYVGRYFDIEQEQADWLKKHGNQSENVRLAIKDYIDKISRAGIY